MGVHGPRVGPLDTARQMAERGCGGGPQPECAVDVQPRAVGAADVGYRFEGIEGAGGHVPGLGADDRRAVGLSQRLVQRGGSIRPWSSAATRTGVLAPSPSSRSAV